MREDFLDTRTLLTDATYDLECPDCLQRSGLCRSCQRLILPQLAINRGWLKLIGNAEVEQTNRQEEYANRAAVEKAKRRADRKSRRTVRLLSSLAA